MADMTMCYGDGCEIKGTCHRHIARPCPIGQSRFVIAPHENGGTRCAYYMPTPPPEGETP